MMKAYSERRLVENELMFREPNEKLAKGFIELKRLAKAEGATDDYPDLDDPLPFYCECADPNCRERIELTPSEYLQLHKQKTQFVILPGHIAPEIERPINVTKKYVVIEKFSVPEAAEPKARLLRTKKPKA